jgi:hypothetical protein
LAKANKNTQIAKNTEYAVKITNNKDEKKRHMENKKEEKRKRGKDTWKIIKIRCNVSIINKCDFSYP